MPLPRPAQSELRSPGDGAMEQRNLTDGYRRLPEENTEFAAGTEHIYIYLLAVVLVGALL